MAARRLGQPAQPIGTGIESTTRTGDGTVLVTLHGAEMLNAANSKLAAMGSNEKFMIDMKLRPATVGGPVNCTPTPGSTRPGPPVKALVGSDGTETASANSGGGTYHLAACYYENDDFTGNSGISGAG